MGVPKLPKLGVPWLWSPITFRADLWLKWDIKKSCSFHQELSNGMLHATYTQGNRGDSWLLVVRSQTGSLTLGPSFGHNLCFRYPNEQCEPILDIYILRDFQWYKERYKPLSFGRWNLSLKFWESTGTPSPKVGVALGEWGFTPSCSLTLSYTPGSMWCDSRASSRPFTLVTSLPWLPGFLLTCNLVSPCLGRKPKARVATINLTSVADDTWKLQKPKNR